MIQKPPPLDTLEAPTEEKMANDLARALPWVWDENFQG